jgi:hypothetical protein
MPYNNLSGMSFGDLRVLRPTPKRAYNKEILWKCSCSCGRTVLLRGSKLTKQHQKSCGKCLKHERKKRHWNTEAKHRANIGKLPFSEFTHTEQLRMIDEFCFGLSCSKLSDKYKVTKRSLRDGIRYYRERLNIAYELNYMVDIAKTKVSTETIDKALKTSFINEILRDMLSEDNAEILTDHEVMYCNLFVHTGSNSVALKESQLIKCLPRTTPVREQYLGMYLREKPNIKLYIKSLQEDKLKEFKQDKRNIQLELATQISEIKEEIQCGGDSPRNRGHILKAIELLGKTLGAFEERVRVTEVSAADALDNLLEMAKTEIKELPKGSPVDEVWELKEDG